LTSPLVVGPNTLNPPGARNTRIVVIKARLWMTWMARHPPKAFHHQ
jgi:hypothetical protein